jgi:hypothetical protein
VNHSNDRHGAARTLTAAGRRWRSHQVIGSALWRSSFGLEVKWHDDHDNVGLVGKCSGDPAAGSIVKQQLTTLRKMASGEDQRDLGVWGLNPRHVPTEAPLDVAIGALLDVQRDSCKVTDGDPAVDQQFRRHGVTRGVNGSHLHRVDAERIPRGLENGSIQVFDHDHREVSSSRRQ